MSKADEYCTITSKSFLIFVPFQWQLSADNVYTRYNSYNLSHMFCGFFSVYQQPIVIEYICVTENAQLLSPINIYLLVFYFLWWVGMCRQRNEKYVSFSPPFIQSTVDGRNLLVSFKFLRSAILNNPTLLIF